MRIDLGAKVRTKDGHSAGHIKQAIWDPRRNEVIEIVVSTGGLLSHDAIVSSEMLESAAQDGGEIVLDITKHDLDELVRFEPSAYTTPPAEWAAPSVHGFTSGGYLFPLTDRPPTVDEPPTEDRGHGRGIRRGMKVRDATGEVMGEVAELRVDDQTGELRGILVSRHGELLEIDSENVDRIGGDVHLITAGGEIRRREKT